MPGNELSVVCEGLLSRIFRRQNAENTNRGFVVALTSAQVFGTLIAVFTPMTAMPPDPDATVPPDDGHGDAVAEPAVAEQAVAEQPEITEAVAEPAVDGAADHEPMAEPAATPGPRARSRVPAVVGLGMPHCAATNGTPTLTENRSVIVRVTLMSKAC